jgi:hypothetical protein
MSSPPAEREVDADLLAGVGVGEFFDGLECEGIGEQDDHCFEADVNEGVGGGVGGGLAFARARAGDTSVLTVPGF